MTGTEEKLVLEHLDLVDTIIRARFHTRAASVLMTYEDLQAVGREALCRAAARYRPELGRFTTFAGRCVVNAIIDHCRREAGHARAAAGLADEDGKEAVTGTADCVTEEDLTIGALAVRSALDEWKRQYTGVARLGVEAVELKLLGFRSAEIAERYGTSVNNVNAWISRLRSKLRKDGRIPDPAR